MATININRNLNDPFYRYKMSKLQIKTQGKRTILINLSNIAKELDRSPIYIMRFFGYKFGTSIEANIKKNLYSISGIQESTILQKYLDEFIEYFVLCSICNNPETKLILSGRKNDEVYKKCIACGNLSSDNMKTQRLTTFIAQHLHDTIVNKKNDQQTEIEYNDESNEIFKDENNLLFIFIEKKKNGNKLNDINTINEIINIAKELNLIEKISFYIAKYLFTENILKEIIDYKNLFQKLCTNNFQAQIYLLDAIEILINNNKNKICHKKFIEELFYRLYDEDIIEEDTFINWYENCLINENIRQMTKGFIQWLNKSDDDENSKEKLI